MSALRIMKDSRQEFDGMNDDLIFVMSIYIMAIAVLHWFDINDFAHEALIAIINTMSIMYYNWKHNK